MRTESSSLNLDRHGEIGAGNFNHAAIIGAVIHHSRDGRRDLSRRKASGTSGGVLAELTPISRKRTPGRRERPMIPREWPGTSVIFAPVVLRLKSAVERLREAEAPAINEGSTVSVCQEKGSACQAISSARDGVLHPLAFGGAGLFEILVEKPRAGSPNVAVGSGSGLAQFGGGLDRQRKILREILVHHVGLGIDEAGIEMAFEHHQHALDARVGRLLGLRGLNAEGNPRGQRGETECGQLFREITPLHSCPRARQVLHAEIRLSGLLHQWHALPVF